MIENLRMGTYGPAKGKVVRIIHALGWQSLVTTNIFCDGEAAIEPRDVFWVFSNDLRRLTALETLGAMAR